MIPTTLIYDVDYEAVAELEEFVTFYTSAPQGDEVQYVYHLGDANVALARNNSDFRERPATAEELKQWDVDGCVTTAYVTKWILDNYPEFATEVAAAE